MKILNVLSSWGPEFGGPFINTLNLAANLINRGHYVKIIAASKYNSTSKISCQWQLGKEKLSIPIKLCRCYEYSFCFSSEFIKEFQATVREFDLVFIHGLWRFPTSFSAYCCRKLGIPYIIFTHAMLSAWSMRQNSFKKWIYLKLIEKENLDKAKAVLVMDQQEKDYAANLGIKSPKKIFFNALNKEDIISAKKLRDIKKQTSKENINILYLGRIHPKKGLFFAVQALKELVKIYPDIIFTAAGPVEDQGYFRKVKNYISKNNLKKNIKFKGLVTNFEKEDIYSNSDIFLLPSYDDSRPLALLEAMSYGIPVATTKECKLEEIDNKMGYIVGQNSDSISDALIKLTKDKDKANQMGRAGHKFVLDNFIWNKRILELERIIKNYVP
ncbi:MAG: glycosyltransferase [Candidatus Omnitrophota bacterium]